MPAINAVTPSPPPTPSYPLADAADAVRRWWRLPVVVGLLAALAVGGFTAMRPRLYESHVVARVSLRSELASLAMALASGVQAFTPPGQRREVYELAESLVRLMSNRIMDRDQAFSQYMTAYTANTFARVAQSDAALITVCARLGEDLERSWPGAAADLDILRERAVRVERSKPDNVLTLRFLARDPDTARRGASALGAALERRAEGVREEQQAAMVRAAREQTKAARKLASRLLRQTGGPATFDDDAPASPGARLDAIAVETALQHYRDALAYEHQMASASLVIFEPALEILQSASTPTLVSPRTGPAALRAGALGFVVALILVAAFGAPGRRES